MSRLPGSQADEDADDDDHQFDEHAGPVLLLHVLICIAIEYWKSRTGGNSEILELTLSPSSRQFFSISAFQLLGTCPR